MVRAAEADAAEMHQCREPGNRERGEQIDVNIAPEKNKRWHARRDGAEIFAERHGRERDRRGKTDCRRQPAGDEAESRMIDTAQKVIFAARSRQHGCELGVAECSTNRHNAADHPQQQQREAGRDIGDLKSQAGEDTDADHIRNDDRRRGDPGYARDRARHGDGNRAARPCAPIRSGHYSAFDTHAAA